MRIRGVLRGHTDWVTSIATPDVNDASMSGDRMEVLSASRDKSVIQWQLAEADQSRGEYGRAHRGLRGHSHFVSDVVISRDGHFALSASWDRSLRLWDLNYGTTHKKFTQSGHTGDVLSVAFSADNRQIVSGSRDRSIKLWNTLGECRLTMDNAHNDWVSSVKFSPNPHRPIVVSGGWDKIVRVWSVQNRFSKQCDLVGHTGYVNTVAIAPDGSLCATGGKDGSVLLWDLNEGKRLHTLDAGDIVHSLSFAPNRFWLCAGTASSIKIIDLASKESIGSCSDDDEDFQSVPGLPKAECTSLAWSPNGSTLFAGYTDALIRVWVPYSSTH